MARRLHGITDVPGIRVGHAQDPKALTGVTVVLCERGAVAGMDQRGGAPGTREMDALRPMHLVQEVHAVVLAGGSACSAFGLDAASGVMRYLEERGVGFETPGGRVPIVPAAILYDLAIGNPRVRPDAAMGYAACQAATDGPVPEGNVGAGTGATVGKILGMSYAMKGGIGTAALEIGGGIRIGALVAVNALGDVVDPHTGKILAGARRPDGTGFADTMAILEALAGQISLSFRRRVPESTVIGVVATNAALTKEEANKVARMAHNGLARAIRPAHTMVDGDTLFALATGEKEVDVSIVGAFAAEVVAEAIVRAIQAAEGVAGIPTWRDLAGETSDPT
ncbi:P1 family peptidase [Thermoflexus sp.]|jgi:L-aminopeptidase/D-esterase-like protein|uniref:P1 family peptidase n=1 Tax=Thermoflexus sp. TaxID=1969742 RepID=UPI003BFC88B3